MMKRHEIDGLMRVNIGKDQMEAFRNWPLGNKQRSVGKAKPYADEMTRSWVTV